MKPRIYLPTEKDFSHNGLGILTDTSRCDVTEEANGKYELELEYPLESRFKDYFDNGYQIKAKPNDQEDYHVFEIKNTYQDTINNSILVYGQSRTYKLGYREIQILEISSKSGQEAMKMIEENMDQKSDIALYSDIETESSTQFEARNVLNCIAGEQGSMLQYWGGEIKREPFKLSLLKRRGRDNVGTVKYGKDLNGLKIRLDWSSIITRVLPYADLQNGDDGQTKRIYGDNVDSDLIKNYPDVYSYHVQFTEEQGVTDLKSLNRIAKNYFKSINPGSDKPKVSIELDIEKLTDSEELKEFSKMKNYGLFDTFSVYHKLYNIHIDSKVTSIVYDSLNEKNKKIIAGDSRMSFFTKQNYDLQETIKTLTKKGYMSEFVDYITGLINGVEGGSILQYPKNKPHTHYFMDTDSVDTAKDVIAINNKGIGFSRDGWLGPFKNAWGINGELNADFIKVGILNGVQIQAENENFLIDMFDGKIKFIDVMSDKILGQLFSSSSASTGKVNGLAISQYPGYIFSLNSADGNGKSTAVFQIPADSTIDKPKANIFGEVNIKGSLYVNGVKIDTNGSGQGGGSTSGSWNGQYPPELTNQGQKFAWELYQILLSLGYTKAAACGILGNVEGEAGPSMNPDVVQGGGSGPGYGCVQWDGSAYPLVGSPTWDGREYVQRLMAKAGIKDDYTTYQAQGKLIDWCMYNGQWIGKVNPTSVSAFKNLTDPQVAATAFELNFERPAAAHPERKAYALNWFNLFRDLDVPSKKGEEGLNHLESLVGRTIGNGQCYGLTAEYSGYLGGCGLGAGTKYGFSHVIGNTMSASDIGSAYNWSAVGWKVINNPQISDLVVGAIINWSRGGRVGSWYADGVYGHTGVIRGLEGGKIQTYEQNTELGQVCGKLERAYYSPNDIASIVIPPK
ncbi:phage tail spike protein [Vagococcus sp. JNUCC 83]